MITEILTKLSKQDEDLLTYAFENGLTNQFIEYDPGRFIGVNILPEIMPSLHIEQTAGRYATGSIRGN